MGNPGLIPIQGPGFQNLISQFGLQLSPSVPQWFLSNAVAPVALVGQDIFPAVNSWDVAYSNPFTAGLQTNPVANTILADTGAFSGERPTVVDFLIYASLAGSTAAVSFVSVQKRDPTNTSNVWTFVLLPTMTTAESNVRELKFAVTINPSERVRCQLGADLTGQVNVAIFSRPRPHVPPFLRPTF